MYFSRLIHARFGSAICAVVLFGSTCLLSARAQQSAPVAQPAVDSAQPAATDASAPAVAPADAAAPAPAAAPCTGKHCPRLKKIKKKKEKPPIVTPATIARGTFTVDGVIGKAALNYDISNLKFIYFYAPGIGAVVISDNKFLGGMEQKNAFNGQTLTVTVGGHEMQLYSDTVILGRHVVATKMKGQANKKPESAWVSFDPSYTMASRFPVVGYGNSADAPYAWPGSKMNAVVAGIDPDAPPIPTALKPKLAPLPCLYAAANSPAAAAPAPRSVQTCVPAKAASHPAQQPVPSAVPESEQAYARPSKGAN